jgi:crotonobetainyl-CoA:carnitine CoA-transferase CaiB-like acyl-CoA transferase
MLSSEVFRSEDGDAPRRPGLDRGLHGTSPCLRLYPTQDGWVQVAATGADEWRALCAALDPESLADLADLGYAERVAPRAAIEPRLAAAFLARTAVGWVELFDEIGVPAEVVVDTVDGELAMFDADNERLGLVVDVEHPTLGRIRQFGALVSFSASPEPTYGPPPMWGQHTRTVLAEHGFDPAEIEALLAQGVVAEPDPDQYPWVI